MGIIVATPFENRSKLAPQLEFVRVVWLSDWVTPNLPTLVARAYSNFTFEACCHPLMTVGAYDYGRPQENLIIWVSSQGQLVGIVSRVPGTVTMPTPGRAL